MKRVLIIGSLNIDMVVDVDHMPAVGETILSGGLKYVPGGKGANQACAVGRLGVDVTMLGAVGKDSYADMQRESLTNSGVDVSKLIVREDAPTGVALIPVNKEGDNYIIVISGANATISPEDVEKNRALIEESDIVMFQLEIPLDTVLYAAKLAKELGKTVILDPAPVPKEFPEELYQYVDVIKPNETELGMLTGISDVEMHLTEATAVLRQKGVKNVLVTLGGDGVFIDSAELGACRIPAHKVTAVDTTAAGDSFTAGLAAKLLEGKNLKEAAEFANYVSAIVVTRPGAQSSIPTLEEVEEYIALS
ncbi:MAG: ribokinase [Lachnospiraceae bacterium]|nr:ribokinase [Lachnospiraceae bacterium]